LSDGQKKNYIEMFGSFMEPFKCQKLTEVAKMVNAEIMVNAKS